MVGRLGSYLLPILTSLSILWARETPPHSSLDLIEHCWLRLSENQVLALKVASGGTCFSISLRSSCHSWVIPVTLDGLEQWVVLSSSEDCSRPHRWSCERFLILLRGRFAKGYSRDCAWLGGSLFCVESAAPGCGIWHWEPIERASLQASVSPQWELACRETSEPR